MHTFINCMVFESKDTIVMKKTNHILLRNTHAHQNRVLIVESNPSIKHFVACRLISGALACICCAMDMISKRGEEDWKKKTKNTLEKIYNNVWRVYVFIYLCKDFLFFSFSNFLIFFAHLVILQF
jgi:hypothetical protein